MAEVFISYSKGNADNIAQQIADALNRAGITCWYMGRDSRHGRYSDRITKAIRECSVFVLILNQDSNQSKNVLSEVNIAFKYDKEIIPFHIDDCEMSDALFYHLSPFTTINANPPDEQRVHGLVEEVADILGRGPLQSVPAKIINRGKCGKNVTYTLGENGLLTISGYGAMWDFDWDRETQTRDTPWWNDRNMISYVEIQYGVTVIGGGAFDSCKRLTSVAIPDSITFIEPEAFFDCAKLTSVYIPNSVISIGWHAFDGAGLTSVSIPRNTEINSESFPGMRVIRRA
ncbi:MAG: leucine-rich repeat protein [Oscillibacter sp.]|nr:leucine-rich repeat protein [Oscillibacter sp.]